jgi:deoxycytidylate deaminase
MKSDYKIKMGCVIVTHGKPISVGFNCQKSHPQKVSRCACVHAEVSALISADTSVNGGIAYIYRERKDGSLGLARPCNNCYVSLKKAGIKKIVYSTYTGYAVERI